MSIHNHFGKMKTYVPYTSKYNHAGMKIYHISPSVGTQGITYRTRNDATQLDQINVPLYDNESRELYCIILDADDGLQHQNKRTFVFTDFADIIKKITNHFTASIWKIINASPLLTIDELLWLKVDDIDGHVVHLKKTILSVIEENNLLRLKTDELESDTNRLEKMLMQIIEENKLLQCRIEALEIKEPFVRNEILYELD
jgi:hypothetical protein